MSEHTAPSVGERIRELRTDESRGQTMSQTALAAAADCSVDVVRKLEQGRYTPSIPTLQRIASALDVEIGDLFRRVRPALATVGPLSGAVALRRAVVSVDDLVEDEPDVEPLDLDAARSTVGYAWEVLWQAHTPDTLPGLLPSALARMRATLREVPPSEQAAAHDLAAQLYQLAGSTLVHLGYADAAHYAAREGLRIAENSGDPLRSASLRRTVSWICVCQGRYREAHHVATTAAAALSPTGESPLPAWSLYGTLLLNGAIAAARDQDAPKAEALLDEARDAAKRTGARNDYQTNFSPMKVLTHVVGARVAAEDYDGVLDQASRMPQRLPLPLLDRVNHLSNIALAHTRLGHDGAALETLLAIRRSAPQWLTVRRTAQMVIRELYDRATPPPLIDLARTAGLLR